jgi:hypothetical protein
VVAPGAVDVRVVGGRVIDVRVVGGRVIDGRIACPYSSKKASWSGPTWWT